jgi:hypothetical protein
MGCSIEMMDVISQLIEHIKDPNDPTFLDQNTQLGLDSLETELNSIQQILHLPNTDKVLPRREMIIMIAELYRLAVLVYLERVGRASSRFSPKVSQLLEQAFCILEKLDFCERPWPLFVIGCEARSDKERALVLDVLDRTKSVRGCGSLKSVIVLIRMTWVQDDLHGENELSCFARYNAVLGAFAHIPVFV